MGEVFYALPRRVPRRVKTNEMCAYINKHFHLNTLKDEPSTINNLHALHRNNIREFFAENLVLGGAGKKGDK